MRTAAKSFLIFICVMSLSLISFASDLEISVAETELKEVFADVPCVKISESASTQLVLEKDGTIFHVTDNTGVSGSAADIKGATDSYLRIKGTCVIQKISVEGVQRILPEAIFFRISSAKGDVLHKAAIKNDIENIYSMGYFESCDASFEEGVLTFAVKEYPVIMSIEVEGEKKVKEKAILDAVGLKRFDVLNTKTLKTSIDRVNALYREKGYYNAEVSTSNKSTEGGIVLTFHIKENKKLFVKKVSFDENKNISSKKLRKQMKTKSRWPLGLFGHSGSYVDADIDVDLLRIEQHYGDQGYLDAKAGRPLVDIKEKKGIYITVPVEEGPLYHLGEVDMEGDLLKPKEELIDLFNLKKGDVMSKKEVHLGVERVRDIYMDEGYAYVQIRPDSKVADTIVNLNLKIKKGDPVYIDKININGNTKTRDKVIRREMKLQEADLFSSTAIKRSKDKLNRLGYFSKVEIEPVPSKEGKITLNIGIEEKPTGTFSLGAGYSSSDKFMGTMEFSENNFLGYGLKSKLGVEYGKNKKSYTLEFVEPWLFDHPVSLGLKLYNTERELLYYTKSSRGGRISMSYPLFEEVRHNIAYTYDEVLSLEDIDPDYEYLISEEDMDGGLTSSVTNTLYRDTTNDFYRPTRGSDASISIEYAGLGGDYHYTRASVSVSKFYPLYKDVFALMVKGRWGTINGAQGDDVPIYERYTLGGLNSIRGFKYGEVGPMDNLGNVIGGKRMVIFNTEITYPIGKIPGLSGLVFLDAGNAYNEDIDITYLKKSYGFGFRWVTPMGPLRLEYGRIINPEEYESSGGWDFSIGTFF